MLGYAIYMYDNCNCDPKLNILMVLKLIKCEFTVGNLSHCDANITLGLFRKIEFVEL